jgi:hypothetical protein
VWHADPKIALLGAMQSLFEASLYTFVFLWTPALAPRGERLPHGMIFACFMMACMAGSAIAGRLLADPKRHPISHYMKVCPLRAPPYRLACINVDVSECRGDTRDK